MAAVCSIELTKPTPRPGSRPCGRRSCRLALHDKLRTLVASKLMQDWSPEQISGWLKQSYRDDESKRVSHETIYRTLFLQARGALKQELVRHLRSRRRIPPLTARPEERTSHGSNRRRHFHPGTTCGSRSQRAIPGHWEGDLLRGARNSHVATLVERHSRFCMLVKVPGKDTATVVTAPSQQVRELPATLRRSLTWDRGLEMAQHKSFTMATDVQVYFCGPHRVPGSAALTKIRMGCCGNTCRRRPICPATRSRS